MKTLKPILPILVTAIVLIGVAVTLIALNVRQQISLPPQYPMAAVTSFDECAAAGYPILESYPERCLTPDGRSFTRDIGNELPYTNMIQIDHPRPGISVTSPLTISGRARGTWYFEASFPVQLLDANGETLAIEPAQAEGEWMTEDFVPFAVELVFDAKTATGTLILIKDNPSGLPEYDAQVEIPVRFGKTSSTEKPSDQICIQVIATAKNPETGEVRDFPTPCDVPEGWETIAP
ncbi:hypothetical protein KJZ71_00300 [Patescibacteria group bacterium]|nr:hypothetical protein [Patescibacteria group bacterium]MDL1953130.1 hypothetical protein [Candidatus Uhrbacteria bacterium UHB]RIL00414.1 MAG: hypothetical protein DCC77_02510 [Candidatus Uhrbacteria bacterium]